MIRSEGTLKKPIGKRRILSGILCAGLLAGSVFGIDRQTVLADSVDSLEVTVGYWGMEEYLKADVALSTLEAACGTHTVIYTWKDNKPAAGTTVAEGIYIEDLMEYYDIDMDAVSTYNFFTKDSGSYVGADAQWTNEKLLQKRYSFEDCFQMALDDYKRGQSQGDYLDNPQNYFKLSDFFSDSADGGKGYLDVAWENKKSVKSMLALRTKSTRWGNNLEGMDDALRKSGLEKGACPTLMYGQTNLTDAGRQLQAHSVYRIHVWFSGAPVVSIDTTNLSGKVGTTETLSYTVDTPDSFLTQEVSKKITWSSSDESVATVDAEGNITFLGEGEVSVTASYNGKTLASAAVSSTGEGSGSDGADGTGEDGSGSGNAGSGSGDAGSGDGDSGTGSDSTGAGEDPGADRTTDNDQNGDGAVSKTDRETDTKTDTKEETRLVLEAGEALQQAMEEIGAAQAAGNTGRKVYALDGESPSDVVIQQESKGHILGWIACGCMLLGAGIEGIYFRRQKKGRI